MMIKLFRNIRQSLLSEGKTSKYLKYAIGEIILVVIGILIALQINNWNDQNKNTKSEFLYYGRILEDFELDKININNLMNQANQRIKVCRSILLDLDSGTKSKNFIMNQFLLASRSEEYVPRDVTFKDLISSGNLKQINDIAVKNSLIQYYSELENKRFQLKQNRDERVNQTFNLIKTSLDVGTQEFEYVNRLLGPEILEILPKKDWTKNKNDEIYKKIQMVLIFYIAMADRERQHFLTIDKLMEEPYQLIKTKLNGAQKK